MQTECALYALRLLSQSTLHYVLGELYFFDDSSLIQVVTNTCSFFQNSQLNTTELPAF